MGFFAELMWWHFVILGFGLLLMLYSIVEECSIISGLIGVTITLIVLYNAYSINFENISIIKTISLLIVYIFVGVMWSMFKWFKFVKERYIKHLEDSKYRNEIPTFYDGDVKRHTVHLSKWIIYWPLSMIGYIFGDLLSDFVDWVVNKFRSVYDFIAKKAVDIQ